MIQQDDCISSHLYENAPILLTNNTGMNLTVWIENNENSDNVIMAFIKKIGGGVSSCE